MVSPGEGNLKWKQTPDGQWQPFTNLSATVSTGAQIYKPSALSLEEKEKCVDSSSEEKKLASENSSQNDLKEMNFKDVANAELAMYFENFHSKSPEELPFIS